MLLVNKIQDLIKPFKSLFSHKESLLLIVSTFIMSFSPVFDKIALKNVYADNAYFILFIENLIATIVISGYLIQQKRAWVKELQENFINLLINGVIYTFLALLFLWAITTGPIALVAAIKKLEVL